MKTFHPIKGKTSYIIFQSKGLGDTLAWFPYVEQFRVDNDCKGKLFLPRQEMIPLLENNSFNADALNINASINTNSELTILSGDNVNVDYLSQGSISQFQSVIQIPMDVSLGQVDVILTLSADYIDQDGMSQEYLRDFF